MTGPGLLVVERIDPYSGPYRFRVVQADPVALITAEMVEQIAQYQELGIDDFASIELKTENTMIGAVLRIGGFTYVFKEYNWPQDVYLIQWPD